MKRIYQGSDIKFNLTLNGFPIDSSLLEFNFYTSNSKDGIKKDQSDIIDGILILQWYELAKLTEGVLFYDYKINEKNVDSVNNVMTDFYIMSGVKDIDVETKDVLWGNLKGNIIDQKDLTDYVKNQVEVGDNKKVDKISGKSLIDDTEIARLKTLKNYDDSKISNDVSNLKTAKLDKIEAKRLYLPVGNYLTQHQDISGKVDKKEGYSLVSNTEITRLSKVTNYNDKEVKSAISKLELLKANQSTLDSEVALLATKETVTNGFREVNNSINKINLKLDSSIQVIRNVSEVIL